MLYNHHLNQDRKEHFHYYQKTSFFKTDESAELHELLCQWMLQEQLSNLTSFLHFNREENVERNDSASCDTSLSSLLQETAADTWMLVKTKPFARWNL